MQPGKPQGFGRVGEDGTPIFALPGNPVSSYVSYQMFVLPALRKLMGRTPYTPAADAGSAERRRCARRPASSSSCARVHAIDGRRRATSPRSVATARTCSATCRPRTRWSCCPRTSRHVEPGSQVDVLLLDRDY